MFLWSDFFFSFLHHQQLSIATHDSRVSMNADPLSGRGQVFTRVGRYKQTVVAIKPVYKKHLEMSRSLRKELKAVRACMHKLSAINVTWTLCKFNIYFHIGGRYCTDCSPPPPQKKSIIIGLSASTFNIFRNFELTWICFTIIKT